MSLLEMDGGMHEDSRCARPWPVNDRTLTAVVEDHPLFRETISAVVQSMPELELGPVAASAGEALERFSVEPPQLALIDLSLEGMTGLDLVAEIARRWPSVRSAVLSGHLRSELARQALEAGAVAYILKGEPDEFRTGIRAVLDRRTYVSPALGPVDVPIA
jgi:DNA-binding NarL/FixJ family response regulator